MKIKKIKLEGVKLFPDITLYPLGHVTTLIGVNAAGKSTLLNAIHEVLSFIHAGTLYSTSVNREWYSPVRAAVTYSMEQGDETVPPFGVGEFFRPDPPEITFVVSRDRDRIFLERALCGKDNIALHSVKAPHPPSKPTSEQLQQIATLERSVASLAEAQTREAVKAKKNSLHQALHQQRKDLEKIKRESSMPDENRVVFQMGDDTVNISVAEWGGWTRQNIPSPKLIRARENPHESIDGMMRAALASRSGRDQSECDRIVKALGLFLEAKVEIFQEKDVPHFLVDGHDYRKLSSGTQVCLYFLSLLHDTPENAVVLWDEPENGLHATRRHKLLQQMFSDTRTYILGTHAPEMAAITDARSEVYRLSRSVSNVVTEPTVRLSVEQLSHRRHAFEVLDDLGVNPAAALFTSSVVVWIEGPTEALFWRKFLLEREDSDSDLDLVEGFDFTLVAYGGQLISHLQANDVEFRTEELVAEDVDLDVLSVCRYPAILVDSDLREEGASLKGAAQRVRDAVDKLNQERSNSAFFVATGGRELENYLPMEALRHAVLSLGRWDEEEQEKIAEANFAPGRYDSVFDSIHSWLKEHGFVWPSGHKWSGKVKFASKVSSNNKVAFMRSALSLPGLSSRMLRWGGQDDVRALRRWILMKRS